MKHNFLGSPNEFDEVLVKDFCGNTFDLEGNLPRKARI